MTLSEDTVIGTIKWPTRIENVAEFQHVKFSDLSGPVRDYIKALEEGAKALRSIAMQSFDHREPDICGYAACDCDQQIATDALAAVEAAKERLP